MSTRPPRVIRALATAGAIAVVGALAGCGVAEPRVVLQNDTGRSIHVFYCFNLPCTEGASGNDVVLSPGKSWTHFFDSSDPTGPVGVATSPGDLLLGCYDDPSPGQDRPPTRTLRLSAAHQCPGQTGQPKVRLVNP